MTSRLPAGSDSAVCIAGMHRSGTSMVAKVLHTGGLFLGAEGELMPALPDNQDGFREHMTFVHVNDQVLEDLGGWWDCPPAMPRGWETAARTKFAPQIDPLLQRFADWPIWGWKDPRNSLTLPLWRSLLPNLKTVICVRNPLEVALSLKRRNTFSYALSFRLWWIYYKRLLAAAPVGQRVVTNYDMYFEDPQFESRRLLNFLGLPANDKAVAAAADAPAHNLRHNRMTTQQLIDADAPPEVVELYLQLCAEAGWLKDSQAPRPPAPAAPPPTSLEVGEPASPPRPELGAARIDRIAALRQQFAMTEQTLRAELQETKARLAELERREREQLTAGTARRASPPAASYEALLARLKTRLARIVPARATIAAVSKGDEQILRVAGRIGLHFPQDDNGRYAGFNPRDSADAIDRLESLRKSGVDFLLLPSTAFWWLEHYEDFRRHLQASARQLLRNKDCILYHLSPHPKPRRSPRRLAPSQRAGR